jgi:hypothetical protein
MNTRKAYIPTADINGLAKKLTEGLAFCLTEMPSASVYADRFGKDIDACRKGMTSQFSEFDLYYINDADFFPENSLWQFEPIPPVITVYLGFDHITKEVVGLYTKAAISAFPMECMKASSIMLPIPCEVPRPEV